jgi:DNA-binding NarL/FixJ family response regulator
MTIRVLLVEDHRMVREALREMLTKVPDIEVVGEAGDAHDGLAQAVATAPDVIVLDIRLPDLNGIEVAARLCDAGSTAKIVAFSAFADKRFVTEMLRSGASAYVTMSAAGTELVCAIRAVAAGQGYFSPEIAGTLVAEVRDRAVPGSGQPLAASASASVAALVVEQASGRVAEANPAALSLLGLRQAGAPGSDWLQAFDPASAARLADACRHAWISPAPVQVEVATGSGGRALSVAVSTFRAGTDAYLLVRIATPGAPGLPRAAETSDVIDALDAIPNLSFVTDALLHIQFGNRAYLELVQAASHDAIVGRSLAQWLALTEADLLRLLGGRPDADRSQRIEH